MRRLSTARVRARRVRRRIALALLACPDLAANRLSKGRAWAGAAALRYYISTQTPDVVPRERRCDHPKHTASPACGSIGPREPPSCVFTTPAVFRRPRRVPQDQGFAS